MSTDPHTDPTGTVRTDPIAGQFIRIYDAEFNQGAPWLRLGGGPADPLWYTDAEVADAEVIGAVPGSSAAIATGWTAADVQQLTPGAHLVRRGRAPHDCEFALPGSRWAVSEYGVGAVLRCDCGKRWQLVGDWDRGYDWVRRYLPAWPWPTVAR